MTATWLALARSDVDAELRNAAKTRPITCRGSGCSACCLGPVPVTREEWAEIAPLVTDTMRERATAGGLRCPALEADGRCGVYERRPLICRAYASHSPAAWCSTLAGVREVKRPARPMLRVVEATGEREQRMLRDWMKTP